MFVLDELKLNKFKLVHLRSNADLMRLVSTNGTIPPSMYTGDEMAVMPQNKLDSIRQADAELSSYLSNE